MPDSRPKGTTPLRKSGMHDAPTDRSSPHSWHCQIPAIRVRVTPTLPDRTRYVTSSVLAAARAGARTHARTERDTAHDWVRVPSSVELHWLASDHHAAAVCSGEYLGPNRQSSRTADEPGGAAPWAPPLPSPAAPAWICSTARSRSTSRVRWSSFRPSFSRPLTLLCVSRGSGGRPSVTSSSGRLGCGSLGDHRRSAVLDDAAGWAAVTAGLAPLAERPSGAAGGGRFGDGNSPPPSSTTGLSRRSSATRYGRPGRTRAHTAGPTHQTGSSDPGKYLNHVSRLLPRDDEPIDEAGHARPRSCRVQGFR